MFKAILVALQSGKRVLFLGRFNPFHVGHEAFISEALRLQPGTPLFVIGSSNETRDLRKNPFSFEQRAEMIAIRYPNFLT